MEKKARFSLGYFLLAFFVLILLQNYVFRQHVQDITYSEFRTLVKEGKVNDLVISTSTIRGKMEEGALETISKMRGDPSFKEQFSRAKEPGHPFLTVRMADADLVKVLDENGIQYRAQLENTWFKTLLSWMIPVLLFVVIWRFLLKKMGPGFGGGLMTVGKSKAKIYVENETKVTFRDVAGVDEAEEELKEIIDFLKTPERFQSLGGEIPKGVLLVGPPGTGKTLLARAVAGEAKVPFLNMSGSDFVEMFVGVGAARVRDLFSQAQQAAPCIIFVDELDALGKARGIGPVSGGHDEREQTLNQLLSEMDGFDTKKGVIIMGATNRPEILDPALLRPGRFDRHILVDRPDLKGREAVFRVHTRKVKLSKGIDLKVLAGRTPGMVGADIATVVNEAALLAARKGKQSVEMQDFEEAIDRLLGGLEKKSRLMNEKEKEIVAYHETGHALMAEFLPTADPVHKISIVPRGISALGYTLQLPTEDRYLMTRSELLDRLAVLLGGRVAEEIRFGEISTGSHNDLFRATDIARRMVKEYGMSETLGSLTFEKERRPLFLGMEMGSSKDYSENTAMAIDKEVMEIVTRTYEKVKATLETKKDQLEKVAELLLEKEVLEGEEMRKLIA